MFGGGKTRHSSHERIKGPRQAASSLLAVLAFAATASFAADTAPESAAKLLTGGIAGVMFYLGALAAVTVYNGVLFVTGRDRCYLQYALFTLGIAAAEIGWSGVGRGLFGWDGSWPDMLLPTGFAIAGVGGALFMREVLQTPVQAPRLDNALRLFAAIFAAVALIGFVLPFGFVNTFLAFAGPLFGVLAIVSAMRCRKLNTPGARLNVLGWAALLAGILVLIGMRIDILNDSALTASATPVFSALGILMLSFALSERAGAQVREHAIDQGEALANAQQQIEALTTAEHTLTQSLSLRNQEVDQLTRRLQESEHRFQQMSHLDPLTGLANQLLLTDRIEQGIIRSKRHNTRTAVIMVDVNGFQALFETFGQDATDALLKMIATRLRGIVREQDTVARPENDEFVIVLEEVFDAEDLQRVVAALAEEFAQPFRIGDQILDVSVSLGSAIYPDGGTDASALLKHAAKLMRRSKEGKRLNQRDVGGGRGSVAA
jgi:diguanylate cyclase (GGDEF)-like protein